MVEGLTGVEYILAWLEHIIAENRLCTRFPAMHIHRLMGRWQADYEELPLNLFEPVLLCAIACAATGSAPEMLQPEKALLPDLENRLAAPEAAHAFLLEGAAHLADRLGLAPNDRLRAYMGVVARQQAAHLRNAAENHALDAFFWA